MLHRLLLMVLVALLAGCASNTRIINSWPADLPPVDLFVSAYQADLDNQKVHSLENYLTWVKRFYQGWALSENGWNRMSEMLVSKAKADEQARVNEKIQQIGLRIAPEWAKEKPERYIYTSTMSVWGDALLESVSREQIISLLDAVLTDLDLLEQDQLQPEDIRIERYFPDRAMNQQDDFFF